MLNPLTLDPAPQILSWTQVHSVIKSGGILHSFWRAAILRKVSGKLAKGEGLNTMKCWNVTASIAYKGAG